MVNPRSASGERKHHLVSNISVHPAHHNFTCDKKTINQFYGIKLWNLCLCFVLDSFIVAN